MGKWQSVWTPCFAWLLSVYTRTPALGPVVTDEEQVDQRVVKEVKTCWRSRVLPLPASRWCHCLRLRTSQAEELFDRLFLCSGDHSLRCDVLQSMQGGKERKMASEY